MTAKRYNLTVSVPYAKKMPYRLFAQGSLVDVPHVDEGADFVHFKFEGGTVVALFYTFEKFRRAYLVTGWKDDKDGSQVFLPSIEDPLYVILSAKGRKVDHLKRALYILDKDDTRKIFRYPISFWTKLSFLINHTGTLKSDILLLQDQYHQTRG